MVLELVLGRSHMLSYYCTRIVLTRRWSVGMHSQNHFHFCRHDRVPRAQRGGVRLPARLLSPRPEQEPELGNPACRMCEVLGGSGVPGRAPPASPAAQLLGRPKYASPIPKILWVRPSRTPQNGPLRPYEAILCFYHLRIQFSHQLFTEGICPCRAI